jgi:hypothetical protein
MDRGPFTVAGNVMYPNFGAKFMKVSNIWFVSSKHFEQVLFLSAQVDVWSFRYIVCIMASP